MRSDFGVDEPPLQITLERLFGLFKTSILLDARSKTFRAEWVSALSDKSPIEISFDDISNVEAKCQTAEGYTNNWIRLELKSGERENIPGSGSTRKTREAVDKIKAYIGWTPADVTTSPRAREVRRNEMLLGIAAIVFVVLIEYYSK